MTIVVIGHGRSPEGKAWGRRINRCETVVRFWDWHWQRSDDYGEKYDFGFVALNNQQVSAFQKHNQRVPMVAWLGYLRTGTSMEPVPNGMEIVDPVMWRAEAFRLMGSSANTNFNLTRGAAAVCWAIEKSRPGGEVVLVGFDNLVRGICMPTEEAFPPDYLAHYDRAYPNWRNGWYAPGQTRCGSHDIAVERPLIESLALRRSVNVTYAETAW